MEKIIDKNAEANIQSWLEGDYDEETKRSIRSMQKESPEELIDAFYQTLSFGTGGLRGIMGPGTNRLNIYTIRFATQGLANYLKQHGRGSVLIGYDCRKNSRLFAQECARVLAGNGIEAFLYHELRPVPLVSFGVRYKKCAAGIMITASHNPPKYNGYKVYWSDGGQVLPPHDVGIIKEVNQITSNRDCKITDFPHPLIKELGDEIDQAYLDAVRPLQKKPQDNLSKGNLLNVIYTSLHGAGITMVPKILRDWGFSNLHLVEAQKEPDGNFPTVDSPNPEEPSALAMGIEQLKKSQADLLLGTDPDTDRLGVVALHQGKPIIFNGNEIACMCLEHLCAALSESNAMPKRPMFVKTIVTSELFRAIAERYQAECLDVLTGFKYIGEKITEWEESPLSYIFGGEESYGYLLGTHVRDKDGVISAALVCEMALSQKLQGKSLLDFLHEIYKRYGIYRESLISLTFEGKKGAEKIGQMMHQLRTSPPQTVGEHKVTLLEDYHTQKKTTLKTGEVSPLSLPQSNVIRLWLEDGTKLVVRPSGTEPKMKLYGGYVCKVGSNPLDESIEQADLALKERLSLLKEQLLSE